MSSHDQNVSTQEVDEPKQATNETSNQPAEKTGWRGVLSKVLPSKKEAKDKPSPNIYPLF